MKKKLAALAVIGALVLAAGCSKTDTASTTTTTASSTAGTSSTAVTAGKLPKASSLPPVTKPTSSSTADKSKLPAKAQAAANNSNLSEDENNCIALVLLGAIGEDPTIETDDNKLAGASGAAIVACVPQDKIASGLTSAMASGSSLTETQKSCLQNEFSSASADDLALFLGILLTGNAELLKPYAEALSTACGIPM